MTSTNIPTSETVRLYSHGAPDGKVDDALLTNSNYGNMQFAVPSQVGNLSFYYSFDNLIKSGVISHYRAHNFNVIGMAFHPRSLIK